MVLDGTELDAREMQRFAAWTNLSETTFVLPPTSRGADYRVRIFTPTLELPFAGHPTLGTCHAWLSTAAADRADAARFVQECDAGLIDVRRTADGLAFAAPPLVRSGPVEEAQIREIVPALGLDRRDVIEAQWVDNGPGWIAVLLASPEQVLALEPSFIDLDLGAVALCEPDASEAIELRAWFPKDGALVEDPVTGSLNASVAEWLVRTGRLTTPYTARQGTALGRAGRIHVTTDAEGRLWIAGKTATRIEGGVTL